MTDTNPLLTTLWRIEDLIVSPPQDWLIEDHHTGIAIRRELFTIWMQLYHLHYSQEQASHG